MQGFWPKARSPCVESLREEIESEVERCFLSSISVVHLDYVLCVNLAGPGLISYDREEKFLVGALNSHISKEPFEATMHILVDE